MSRRLVFAEGGFAFCSTEVLLVVDSPSDRAFLALRGALARSHTPRVPFPQSDETASWISLPD